MLQTRVISDRLGLVAAASRIKVAKTAEESISSGIAFPNGSSEVFCGLSRVIESIKMKTAVIILAVLATALAAPQGARDDSQTKIVRYINDNNGLDHYHFTYGYKDYSSAVM